MSCSTKYNLRHLIYIRRKTKTPDGAGGFTTVWTADPVSGVYADANVLTGTERFEMQRNISSLLTRFHIRFRGDAEGNPYYFAGDSILFRGLHYDILKVEDLDFRGEWLQIDAMQGNPS